MNDKTLNAIRESVHLSVGAALKARRETLGMSLEQVAVLAGVPMGVLELAEKGTKGLVLSDLYLLAATLQMPLIDLLPTVKTDDRELINIYQQVREAEAQRESALKQVGQAALSGLEYISAATAHEYAVPVLQGSSKGLVIKEGATYRVRGDRTVDVRHDAVLQVWHAPQDDTMPLSELTVDADAFLLDGKFWKLVKHDPVKGSQIRPAQGTGKWEWVDSSSLVTLATFGKD